MTTDLEEQEIGTAVEAYIIDVIEQCFLTRFRNALQREVKNNKPKWTINRFAVLDKFSKDYKRVGGDPLIMHVWASIFKNGRDYEERVLFDLWELQLEKELRETMRSYLKDTCLLQVDRRRRTSAINDELSSISEQMIRDRLDLIALRSMFAMDGDASFELEKLKEKKSKLQVGMNELVTLNRRVDEGLAQIEQKTLHIVGCIRQAAHRRAS